MTQGAQFFDADEIFEGYTSRRHRSDSPNETLERPVIVEMVGDVRGRHILDLGCGDGRYGLDLLQAGCASYVGLDSSPKMVQLANRNLDRSGGQVVLTKIEEWTYPPDRFDLVVSRLALHYVADLDEMFRRVHATLRTNGRLVFSIVHPVITSCDRSRKDGGKRLDWIVDDYFVPGARQVYFAGEYVEQFHRSIEDIFGALQDANFVVEHLRESCPKPELFMDQALYARRRRIPLFLFMSGRRR